MEPGIYDNTNSLIIHWNELRALGIDKVFCDGINIDKIYSPETEFKMVLPESIKKIPADTFSYSKISAIAMPGVQHIGNRAFLSCKYLEEVIFSNNLKVIDKSAFKDCSALASIILPESLEKLESEAFAYNSRLKDVYLPYSITIIPAECFISCYELQNINLENIKEFKTGCFGYCTNLKSVNLSNVEKVYGCIFDSCFKLKKVYLNNNLHEISSFMFNECCNLKKIIIPEKVESIGVGAFVGTGIEKLIIPKSIKSIDYAFAKMPNLKEIIIKGTSVEIEEDNFEKCDQLKIIRMSKEAYKKTKPHFNIGHDFEIKFEMSLDELLEEKSFKEANQYIAKHENNLKGI